MSYEKKQMLQTICIHKQSSIFIYSNIKMEYLFSKNIHGSTLHLVMIVMQYLFSFNSISSLQVHVGEYGVHWNFFFTLAGVSILTSTVNVPPKYSGILGSVILVGIPSYWWSLFLSSGNCHLISPELYDNLNFHLLGYQIWLTNGLNVYLLSNERGMDIISRNKEGIFSLFGKDNLEIYVIFGWCMFYHSFFLHLQLYSWICCLQDSLLSHILSKLFSLHYRSQSLIQISPCRKQLVLI